MRIIKNILFLILVSSFISCSETNNTNPGQQGIFCDMETISGSNFTCEQYSFGKSKTQSDAEAKSGKYSSLINHSQQYALDYKIHDIKKGGVVLITVWRKSTDNLGTIILANDKNEILKSVVHPIREENGWELLEINYQAEEDCDYFNTYIHNPSEADAFFDDLTIKYFKQKKLPPLNDNSLKITLDDSNYNTLKQYRNEALKIGVIGKNQKKYVPASVLYQGNNIPVKIRLKGDWTDHLEGDKWSFRIKVSGENSINGLKTFSIQSPQTRSFLREWTMHKLFEQEDILTTRYEFTTVSINNKNIGIYALEEHFDKQLIETRNRREGPIVKFNEEGFWEMNQLSEEDKKGVNMSYYAAAEVLPFKKKRTLKNKTLKENFESAEILMLQYKEFEGELKDIFDLEALSKYYALADLGNMTHGLRWHNLRLYYNPVTNLLEQIGFDCFTERLIEDKRIAILGMDTNNTDMKGEDYLTYQVFNDSSFKKMYISHLKAYSDPAFLKTFYQSICSELDSLEKLLQIEYPNYIEDREFFNINAENIKKLLNSYVSSNIKFTHYTEDFRYSRDSSPYLPSVGLRATSMNSSDTTLHLAVTNYHSGNVSIIGHGPTANEQQMVQFDSVITFDRLRTHIIIKEIDVPKTTKYLFFRVNSIPDSVFTKIIEPWKSSSLYFSDKSNSQYNP